MYVRKFEADSLDEALKEIKKEMGPDAIILKTVTNKGLKGAFKNKKIEITAAISERNYVKKAKVDHVLQDDQKDKFYKAPASYISNMIDVHDEKSSIGKRGREVITNNANNNSSNNSGYGNLGLNKKVITTNNETQDSNIVDNKSKNKKDKNDIADELDAFLNTNSKREEKEIDHFLQKEVLFESECVDDLIKEGQRENFAGKDSNVREVENIEYEKKIDRLEKKLFELSKMVETVAKKEATGIYQLRLTLKSLDVNELYIQKLIKKALFELGPEELENVEVVFEYALREMLETIKIELPLFSSLQSEKSIVTVIISETTSGQSTMALKLAALKDQSVLIKYAPMQRQQETVNHLSERIFKFQTVYAKTIPEVVSECRKACEANKTVFIDLNISISEREEIKKMIDGIKRSFENVEVLASLSAIHSELYNRKVLSIYGPLANGIVIAHMDLCLNFGSIFNIAEGFQKLPLKFFGTGEIVPDDLEAATGERILAGIFQL